MVATSEVDLWWVLGTSVPHVDLETSDGWRPAPALIIHCEGRS
jgi:hypothetical protein